MIRRIQVNPVQWSLPTEADIAEWKRLDIQFLSFDHTYPPATNIFPTERLEMILCHTSFLVRATDLALFMEKCPPEALKDNYQIIVDNIFSHRNKEQAWDLRCMRRMDHPKEAAAVFRFLAPDGPLITTALRLMDDHNFLLEFPLEGLPYHLQQKFQRMDIPSFFANKVAVTYDLSFQRNVVQNLLLNPFEYYFFCFGAINLLGLMTGTGRSPDYLHGWAALQDTVYTNILEDYLTYYFPCDGSGVPCHNFNYSVQQANEAVFMANSLLRQQYPKPNMMNVGLSVSGEKQSHHFDDNIPRLFKPSILQDQSGAAISRDNLFHSTHPSAYKEVWRSETILHVFMELWMCVFDDNVDKNGSLNSSSPSNYGGLPSVEVVKSIRMLVRHLHYFINCVNSHAMHPMEDIRRNSYPIFQKRLYTFLRYLFQHWPLDNSFRIVYETWLSHIQPWRYVNFERTKNHQQPKEMAEAPVDRRWHNFIMENILFYSKIFSQMLMRLERVDLSATKNALMFYRVAKVMTNQETLKAMLMDIETQIQNYDRQSAPPVTQNLQRTVVFSTPAAGRSTPISNTAGYFGGGKLSPIASPPVGSPIGSQSFYQDLGTSVLRMAHLKQVMKEFEYPHYVHEPMFSDDNKKRMNQLLVVVAIARDSLYESASKLTNSQLKSRSLFQWFVGTPPPSQVIAQTAAERTKAGNQLEFARNQFAQFFEVSNCEISDQTSDRTSKAMSFLEQTNLIYLDSSPRFNNGASGSGSSRLREESGRKYFLPANVLTDDVLVPLGNPDISLIRSDECRLIVRMLYFFSSLINNQFQKKMETVYFSRSWKGRITRAMLAEPKEYYVCEKRRGPRKPLRSSKYLPPRLSLRFLGSYYSWCYVFILLVLGCFLGLSSGGWISLNLIFYTTYVIFRIISEPVNKYGELHQRYLSSQAVEEREIGWVTKKSQRRLSGDRPENETHQRRFRSPDSCGNDSR